VNKLFILKMTVGHKVWSAQFSFWFYIPIIEECKYLTHVLFVFVWNVFTNTDNRKNVKEQSMRQTIDIAIK
jgi:hypothetical protein